VHRSFDGHQSLLSFFAKTTEEEEDDDDGDDAIAISS
jgi:hypothetical protein